MTSKRGRSMDGAFGGLNRATGARESVTSSVPSASTNSDDALAPGNPSALEIFWRAFPSWRESFPSVMNQAEPSRVELMAVTLPLSVPSRMDHCTSD
jgi:hypothetical protein